MHLFRFSIYRTYAVTFIPRNRSQSLRFTFVVQQIRCLRNSSVLSSVTLTTRSASAAQPYCHDTSSLHSLSCHFTLLIYFTPSSICTEHIQTSSRNNEVLPQGLSPNTDWDWSLFPVSAVLKSGLGHVHCLSRFGLVHLDSSTGQNTHRLWPHPFDRCWLLSPDTHRPLRTAFLQFSALPVIFSFCLRYIIIFEYWLKKAYPVYIDQAFGNNK